MEYAIKAGVRLNIGALDTISCFKDQLKGK